MSEYDFKAGAGDIPAPQNIPPDVIPQERITGDILHGHGPRRGNLERLLRYWRPIMRKEGGFRRCRVILADHPELYPLNNICAWLHHETTGLWPNEGCHHPGMKNCRRKLKKLFNGSLWSDSQFNNRLRKINGPGRGEKSMYQDDYMEKMPVVTADDENHAVIVAKDFAAMEPNFFAILVHPNSWEMVGDDEYGQTIPISFPDTTPECC